MRNLPLVALLSLSACVIIPASELDERKASYPFTVDVLSVSPREAFQCEAPGAELTLQVSPSMADIELTPTVSVGDLRETLDPFVVPASGEVVVSVPDLPDCDAGVCDEELTIQVSTPEGASAETTATVVRYGEPDPELLRVGLVVDDEVVEGDDLLEYVASAEGVLDPREAPVLFGVVRDPLLEVDADIGLLEVLACPPDVLSNDPACERLDIVAPPGIVGGERDERVIAIQVLELGAAQCELPDGVQLHARLVDGPCDEPFSAELLPPLQVLADCDGDGEWPNDGDCDDSDASIGSDDCDADGDGYLSEAFGGDDCDDDLAEVNPDAVEVCDGVDTDCQGGAEDDELDGDGDGYVVCAYDEATWRGDEAVVGGGDCADDDGGRHPGATEVCDEANIDTDCDGNDDAAEGTWGSGFLDTDGDGLGSDQTGNGCFGVGVVDNDLDCDDDIFVANGDMPSPGTPWGGAPLAHCVDADRDGFGDMNAAVIDVCPGPGWVPPSLCTDCNDDPMASGDLQNPGRLESCDGVDTDCDGSLLVDETDGDTDGWLACAADKNTPKGAQVGDCDDGEGTVYPGASEVPCNGVDEACDGLGDEADPDADFYLACDNYTGGLAGIQGGGDCEPLVDTIHPGALEICDGVDQNCNDSDDVLEVDDDGDGYVECLDWVGAGSVIGGGDCDDSIGGDDLFPGRVVHDGVGFPSLAAAFGAGPASGLYELCGAVGGGELPSGTGLFDVEIVGLGPGPASIVAPMNAAALSGVGYRNVTITGVTISGVRNAPFGGGIDIEASHIVLMDCLIDDNEGTEGAGVRALAGDVTLVDTVVSGNRASFVGGGVMVPLGHLTLSGTSTIAGNSASEGGGVWGYSNVTLNAPASIVGNTAYLSGGGIVVNAADAVVDGTGSVAGNSALDGGAIDLFSGGTVRGITISGNFASSLGGAVSARAGTTVLEDVTVFDNEASLGGGLSVQAGASVSVTGAAFEDNLAGFDGGAIYAEGLVTLSDSTFVGNAASSAGDDVFVTGVDGRVEVDALCVFDSNPQGVVTQDGSVIAYDPSSFAGAFACTQGGCQ